MANPVSTPEPSPTGVAEPQLVPTAPSALAGNAAPDAIDDCAVTDAATPLKLSVLANDTAAGQALAIVGMTQPGSGRVALGEDGSLTFTPGEPGRHSIIYQVSDGRGGLDSAEVNLFVNPADGKLPTPALAGLGDQQLSQVAAACAVGTSLDLKTLQGAEIMVPAPAAGQRIEVAAQPGQVVQLQDPAFVNATYLVVDDGLLVVTQDGRMVFIDDFIQATQATPPAMLSVNGGAPIGGEMLLANVEPIGQPAGGPEALTVAGMPDAQLLNIQPAAGPDQPGSPPNDGGGASFGQFEPGSIGDGLNPLGPLGPTALNLDAPPDLEPEPGSDGAGGGEPPAPPPAANEPPTLLVNSDVTVNFGELTKTPEFQSGPPLPEVGEKQTLPANLINGVDERNLVVGPGGDAAIVFRDEVAAFQSTLGVYLISPDGRMIDPKIVFSQIEHADAVDGLPAVRPGGGPLQVGDQVLLSELYGEAIQPGTKFGLFLVADGHGQLGPVQDQPLRFETEAGAPATVNDASPPRLFAGDVQIEGDILHSIDRGTPGDPTTNALNPDGTGHVISGFAPNGLGLTIGFEDKTAANSTDHDFNDLAVDVVLAPDTISSIGFLSFKVALDARTADDSTQLNQAVIEVGGGFQPGDKLSIDTDLLTGTGISLTEDPGSGRLILSGLSSAANYQTLLRDVSFQYGEGNSGPRQLTFSVTDADGLSSPERTVDINPTLTTLVGGGGADILNGSDANDDVLVGRTGNDTLRGRDGNDILDGGLGRDILEGGLGNDLLFGGFGPDQINGGLGADRHIYFALGDRGDTIAGFNASEGDVLDFSDLLEVTGSNGTLDDFVKFDTTTVGPDSQVQVSVDIDGTDTNFGFVSYLTLVNPTGVATPDDAVTNPNLVA